MMHVISADTAVDSWQSAVNFIVGTPGSLSNLIVEIRSPAAFDSNWLAKYDPRLLEPQAESLRHVVNTVFPYRLASLCSTRAKLYSVYQKTLSQSSHRRWGTYFGRLIAFGPDRINQLERCIDKLNKWQRAEAALVFHLSSADLDSPTTRGGPCWHFGEILWKPDDSLDLVVVYRNHDYFHKALGNFIALSLLLKFICMHSNKRVGRLVCHSVHVYKSSSASKLLSLSRL